MDLDPTLDAPAAAPTIDDTAESALSGNRRSFIKGIAAAGASTMAAAALDAADVLDFGTEQAAAASPNDFSSFRAIAPSSADVFQAPEGYRTDVIIGYEDTFQDADGNELRYGYNNDFLAFFPLPAGSQNSNEGLLFVNHEYPGPFLQHGTTDPKAKTREQVELERDSVGNSVLHVRRNAEGVFAVVERSIYNRRITGKSPETEFTGPLAGDPAYPGIGTSASGSLANCSGGITPWGTALSCEENYMDYGSVSSRFGYGWTREQVGTDDYYNGDGSAVTPPAPGPDRAPVSTDPASRQGPAKYGWVVETDPYDPSFRPRKHTALGRFRHENTAFRATPNQPFVLYMGDDVSNGGVYKFVSRLPFRPGFREENRRILEEGELFIARWEPEGRRRFTTAGDVNPITPTEGTGRWERVREEELVDTQRLVMARVNAESGDTDQFSTHFATNRPEDIEVADDGTVYIALTNNSSVRDVHGSIRQVLEAGNDAAATTFTWRDYAAGGQRPGAQPGEEGFSSPDNLVFDKAGNLWVVTDISSSALNVSETVKFHGNNAVFMIPKGSSTAFRFATAPVEAEATGPYFTPDERTLFVNIQHPGEESDAGKGDDNAAQSRTITSYWPRGNKTLEQNPQDPLPSMVTVTKLRPNATAAPPVIPVPPAGLNPDGTAVEDARLPRVSLLGRGRQQIEALRGRGLAFVIEVDEPVTIVATLRGRLTSRARRRGLPAGRGRERRLAQTTLRAERAGRYTLRLRPSTALRVVLRRERRMPAALLVRATDAAGNVSTRRKRVDFV